MADINTVILVGRLTRDAELRYTSGGTAVSRLGLAINRRRRVGEQWEDEAHFFDVVVWGKQAESLNPYLVKGKQIGIEGQLRQNRWEQDGQKRSRVEVHANNVQLLGGRGDSGDRSSGGGGSDAWQGQSESRSPAQSSQDDFEDDIPF